MEHDHVFKIDAVDMPPVPYCDESSDEEMEAQSKGPNGKTPVLPLPPTDPEEKKSCLMYKSQQPLPNH